jgi:hypothetical protein
MPHGARNGDGVLIISAAQEEFTVKAVQQHQRVTRLDRCPRIFNDQGIGAVVRRV